LIKIKLPLKQQKIKNKKIMKTKLLLTAVAIATLLISQTSLFKVKNHSTSNKTRLTNEQMSLLNGKGCSAAIWAASLIGDADCALGSHSPYTCLASFASTVDCILGLDDSAPLTPGPCYTNTRTGQLVCPSYSTGGSSSTSSGRGRH